VHCEHGYLSLDINMIIDLNETGTYHVKSLVIKDIVRVVHQDLYIQNKYEILLNPLFPFVKKVPILSCF
jgi:hypothetical protein